MKAGLMLPRSSLIVPKPPSRIKLDMAFAVGAGAELKDKSRYRSAGAIVGADWADGLHGRCLNFVAATKDYVEIPLTHTQLNFTSEKFSMIARVYIDTLAANRMIFCRGLALTDGYYWFVLTTGRSTFYTAQFGFSQYSDTAVGSIAIDTWYTLGLSRNGASVRLYQNGVDSTTRVGVHIDPDTCARPARIGIYDDEASTPYDGRIEFLRIFGGIALSAPEHLAYHRALA